MALTATAAEAQELTIGLGETGVTERALQIITLITVLSLAPSILIMVTSFSRIVVVLSLLRDGDRRAAIAAPSSWRRCSRRPTRPACSP
jgi:flagellar biosynthesis protein FliP